MRSHEADIVSLSWCPVKHNIFQENGGTSKSTNGELEVSNGKLSSDESESSTINSNKENDVYLLASGSKDRIIYFWRAGTDCRYESSVSMPHQSLSSGFRRKIADKWDKTSPSSWICVKWIDPYTLISGSPFGELLEWNLANVQPREKEKEKDKLLKNKTPPSNPKVKALHGNHTKGLYCVACPDLPSRPNRDKENRHIWSTAVDKKLICTSLRTGKVTAEITTIGGIVYCLAISPLDPNRIAIGIGDSKILIWNMASENTNFTVLWQRVNGKVMALEWHPTDENLLAFGTGEGRVGLFDVSSPSKPPVIFRQYHRRCVYRLCWAPPIIKPEKHSEDKLALFSVGDGDVLQMNLETPDAEPENLQQKFVEADRTSGSNKPIGRSDILWKPDRSVIALGNENGVIYILDATSLVKQQMIFAHKKLVQSLRWHPATVTSDAAGGLSPCHTWLATASDVLKVFDVQPDSTKEVAVFNLQKEKIVEVSWSPHINGRLVSVSYDYTVQVWDVINKAPLVSYLSHHNAVLTAVWSPLDPDVIISGSADNTLRVWRLSEQTDKRPSEKRKTKINNRLKKMANVPEAVDVTKERSESPVASNSTNLNKSENEIQKECISSQVQKIKSKSLFPVSGSALNLSRHLREHFRQWKEAKSQANESKPTASKEPAAVNGNGTHSSSPPNMETGYLDFFSDGNAMRRLLMAEEVELSELGHQKQLIECMLWRGDVTGLIQEAIQKKQLTPYLVAMAPMASVRMWKDACSVYAEQLSNQGEHMRAASFLIAIHKIEEAVQLLADNKLYREAIALAKCRLPSNDPLIRTIMSDFAKHSLSNGQLHLAAHCLLSLDEPLTASQMLARCKDLSSMRLAALLALEANAHDIAVNLAKNCFRSALIASDFDTCQEILDEHPGLKFLNLWANASKCITESAKPDVEAQFDWIKANEKTEKINDTIIEKIRQDAKSYPDCYETLRKHITDFIQLDTDKQLWLYISCELTLAGTAERNLVSLKHVVKAMSSAYKYQMLNGSKEPLLRLCMLLFPKGPMSQENLFKNRANYEENEKKLMSSINSYMFAGIFGWLSENVKNVPENWKQGETKDLEWIKEVIDFFRFDLINAQNLQYFKNIHMIENLEHKIALSKCVPSNEKIEGRVILTAVRKQNRSKSNPSSPKVVEKVVDHNKSTNANGKEETKTEDNASSSNKENTSAKECKKEEVVVQSGKCETKKETVEELTKTSSIEGKIKIDEGIVVENEEKMKVEAVESGKCEIKKDIGETCIKSTPIEVKTKIDEGIVLEDEKKIEVKVETGKTETKKDNVDSTECVKEVKRTEATPHEVKLQSGENVADQNGKNKNELVVENDKKKGVTSNACAKQEKVTAQATCDKVISEVEKDLSCIKEFKAKFESERISVPNPYSAFFDIQNFVKSLTKDAHPDLYEDMENKLQEAWNRANEACN
ncbi:gem-associated protein 5 isoform X2 [Nilaparvata lugens]|nr:gem-associated protein 5 isoform X2 [Nilaparvata lugens]